MKKYQLIVLFLLFGLIGMNHANGQTDMAPSSRAVYAEFGGTSGLFAFNYDARFDRNDMFGWGYRFGIGGIVINDFGFFNLPLSLNYLAGKDDQMFEISAGTIFITGSDFLFPTESTQNIYLMGQIYFGYRFQPSNSGFMFRAGLPVTFGEVDKQAFVLPYPPGFSLGYCF